MSPQTIFQLRRDWPTSCVGGFGLLLLPKELEKCFRPFFT